ncbi:4-carboxymuconolactone decarboxylase [Gordonia pseudamarae]|uniref:4-carboxymuconolactone decarboxylase n=1 Tax=Gordonia pseudamarae TaxID=2831662 RepID=A0ABX6IF61_9ACTN|nr:MULTISPECIES: carboxymuconolactone decarboxylase family protein [Gordonia]MBD0023419.1 carboxymuconolactone decarboxylase family protein [Gordonia sp. (in: high G+C Gram-positive bacteria)]QHN25548.1 4-carboxymuconolactone decarboxylase [Gordonia pseudamarae]QHN34479.1 4-carboxymuconolactone decarboxylase [Gordonia pseudamarae]
MTHRHPHRPGRLALSAAALAAGAALLAGCTGQPAEDAGPTSRTDHIGSVAPALEQYDAEQVQALWNDESLSARDRGLVTIAVHVAGGNTDDLGFYVDKALDDGATPAEVSETITHLGFYAGWPNAMAAVDPVAAVYEERGIDASELPETDPELLDQEPAAESARETAVQDQHGDTSQRLVDATDETVFDDLWLRPGLEPRDRSLVTIVALVTTGQADQIPYHLGRAMDNGLTAEEIDPLMEHLAYFTGWPKVFTAMPVVTETLESR